MEENTHGRRCGRTTNTEIESAFSIMVGRWLVKGKDGEWKLASKKKHDRAQLSRSAKCLREDPRKHLRSTFAGRGDTGGNRNQTKSTGHPARMSNKLTEDFLKRSEERPLPPDCSGLKPATPHHGSRPPNGGDQRRKMDSSPRANVATRQSRTGGAKPDVKKEYAEVKPTKVKSMSKHQGRVLVLNNKSSFSSNTAASGRDGTSPVPKNETRSEVPGGKATTAALSKSGSGRLDTKKEAGVDEKRPAKDAATASRTDGISDGISMLCNGQKKCRVEGCYRAAYKRGLCPAHGGRDKCRVEDSKNYSYIQGLCQADGGGKLGMSVGDGKSTRAKAEQVATKRTKSELNKSAAISDSAAPKTKERSIKTTKKRPKLQTTKKPSKTYNSDAWHSSDLPSLFRNAGHKRVCEVEEGVANLKREKVGVGVVEHDERAEVAARKAPRSPAIESEETVCTVRGCKQPVLSDGFCEKHAKRKRCKEDGCGNLAGKGTQGFCCRHTRKECLVDGCAKNARVRGRCSAHGGKYVCRAEGCKKTAYLRGLCGAHAREAQKQEAGQVPAPQRGSHSQARAMKGGGG